MEEIAYEETEKMGCSLTIRPAARFRIDWTHETFFKETISFLKRSATRCSRHLTVRINNLLKLKIDLALHLSRPSDHHFPSAGSCKSVLWIFQRFGWFFFWSFSWHFLNRRVWELFAYHVQTCISARWDRPAPTPRVSRCVHEQNHCLPECTRCTYCRCWMASAILLTSIFPMAPQIRFTWGIFMQVHSLFRR
jgi:hypothetical protein